MRSKVKVLARLGVGILVLLAGPVVARSQTWQPLLHQPPIAAGTALLLTDGTVMVQDSGGQAWARLTPDANGNYVNGKWSPLASLPAGYAPLYFASAVLPDGRVIVEGGEYNFGQAEWTNLGAIYNPRNNKWTSVAPPSGWSSIGDAQNVVLPNGQFLLANCCSTQAALLDAATLTWTAASVTGKADSNNEEGWTLLPDGTVLTVDTNNPSNLTHAEKYVPQKGRWISAGSTIVKLDDTNSNNSGSHEIGPAMLRPDGTVFATGATGHNAIYTPPARPKDPGTWVAGPDFPVIPGEGQLDIGDGPAALLPNGNVLCAASPGIFMAPTHFFEFDGSSLTEVAGTPNAPGKTSFEGRMLLLPTGQVLFTDGTSDVEIYTSSGSPDPSWAPVITSAPSQITRGSSFVISGTQFNGLSEANAYGDDASSSTNYPLVRLTNQATGHIFYLRTHDHSRMGVAFKGTVTTHVDVSNRVETGTASLEVVANGIPSAAVAVTVQ